MVIAFTTEVNWNFNFNNFLQLRAKYCVFEKQKK